MSARWGPPPFPLVHQKRWLPIHSRKGTVPWLAIPEKPRYRATRLYPRCHVMRRPANPRVACRASAFTTPAAARCRDGDGAEVAPFAPPAVRNSGGRRGLDPRGHPDPSSATPRRLFRGAPSSSRIGFAKERPASLENATYACPWSPLAVNQAIATSRPLVARTGPLTGHAGMRQPSLCTGDGAVHFPFSRRDT